MMKLNGCIFWLNWELLKNIIIFGIRMAIVLKKNLIADLLKIKEILKTRMKLCERKITTDLPKKNT